MSLNKHRPFHIYYGYGYFVSGRTYEGKKYFTNHKRKRIFIDKFIKLKSELDIEVISWVLLENHYHMIITLPEDKYIDGRPVLSEFFRKLHSQTASVLNFKDQTPARQVWYQYWDYCIRKIPDFWKHFNYIIKNPLKHGLVFSLPESYHYKYSSNPVWLEKFSEEGIEECFIKFPVKEWTPRDCE